MTHEEIDIRLSAKPELCQTWVDASVLPEESGIVYLSSVSETSERVGIFHVYVWKPKVKGRPDTVRQATLSLMVTNHLDRGISEIDADNTLAIRLAKRIGGREVGVMRSRKRSDGSRRDTVVIEFLLEDLFNGQQ